MQTPVLDAAWRDWLNDNIARGCTPQSMIDAMVAAGYARGLAETAVRQAAGGTVSAAAAPAGGAYQYDPAPVPAGNYVQAAGRDIPVLVRCDQPQVIVFGDVLTAEECDEVIARARHRLQRSTTVEPATGREFVIRERTSEGMYFTPGEDDLIDTVQQRIAALMHWPAQNGEGLQVLHYRPGGEYRAHFDYFPPEQTGSGTHLANGGQRVATLILYLNDVEDGGETTFPSAGITVSARRGNAVYFRYLNGQRQLDPLSLHAGAPVRAGEKWILTQWMRERAWAPPTTSPASPGG